MRHTLGTRLGLLCLVGCALLLLAGCEPSQRQFVMDWAQEWARSKNLHPRNEDGSLNPMAAVNLGIRAAGFSTGDPDADAALDAFLLVKSIEDADKLMDEGRQNHDPEKMDEAIQRRPGDWTYRLSRGALALEQGEVQAAEQQFAEADRIVEERQIDPLWYANQNITELEGALAHLGPTWTNGPECRLYLERLARFYEQRWQLTQDPADQAALEQVRQQAQSCGQ